jgi:hypothetical protein
VVIEFAPPQSVEIEDSDGPARRFMEILEQYDPGRYELQYVPEGDRQEASLTEIVHPFRLLERTPEKGEAVIRWITADEMRNPAKILEWIFEGDFRKHRPSEVYDKITYARKADELMKLAKQRDDAQARQDMTAFLVKGGRDRKNRVQLGRNRYFDRSR